MSCFGPQLWRSMAAAERSSHSPLETADNFKRAIKYDSPAPTTHRAIIATVVSHPSAVHSPCVRERCLVCARFNEPCDEQACWLGIGFSEDAPRRRLFSSGASARTWSSLITTTTFHGKQTFWVTSGSSGRNPIVKLLRPIGSLCLHQSDTSKVVYASATCLPHPTQQHGPRSFDRRYRSWLSSQITSFQRCMCTSHTAIPTRAYLRVRWHRCRAVFVPLSGLQRPSRSLLSLRPYVGERDRQFLPRPLRIS